MFSHIYYSLGENVSSQTPKSQATTLSDVSTFYPLHNWHLVWVSSKGSTYIWFLSPPPKKKLALLSSLLSFLSLLFLLERELQAVLLVVRRGSPSLRTQDPGSRCSPGSLTGCPPSSLPSWLLTQTPLPAPAHLSRGGGGLKSNQVTHHYYELSLFQKGSWWREMAGGKS